MSQQGGVDPTKLSPDQLAARRSMYKSKHNYVEKMREESLREEREEEGAAGGDEAEVGIAAHI